MNRIEAVKDVTELQHLLETLQAEGYTKDELTILAEDTEAYEDYTSVDIEKSDTIGNHAKAILSGGEPSAEALRDIGVAESKLDDYLTLLHLGGAIVYMVSKDNLQDAHQATREKSDVHIEEGPIGTEIQRDEQRQAKDHIEDIELFRRRD